MLDQDGDGKIHIDEVMLILSTGMGRDIGMSEMIAQSVIDSIDQDRHGIALVLQCCCSYLQLSIPWLIHSFTHFHIPLFISFHLTLLYKVKLTIKIGLRPIAS